MNRTSLSSLRAEDLRSGLPDDFGGTLLSPDDPDYDTTRRIWNGMMDRQPVAIARCRNSSDVSAVITAANRLGISVTVRCGGHNVAGTAVADGAVMIDLSGMRQVTVDPAARTAHAGGGSLLRDVDSATTAHGLMCPAGVFSYTGLGGLAVGGGYGWRARKWGLTCDHITAAEVVLADGSVVEADAESHPDLLWAIRGGGGNFGVVTRFTLALRPVGRIHIMNAVTGADDAVAALAGYADFTAVQPDDVHVLGGLRHARDTDPVPTGQAVLDLLAICSADDDAAVASTAALASTLKPASVNDQTVSYLDLQTMTDTSAPDGRRYYTKSGYLTGLPGAAAERLIAAAAANPSATGSIDIEYLLGAINDPAEAESAFPQRDAPFMVSVYASWDDPDDDDTLIGWARDSLGAVDEWSHRGGYLNYLSAAESDRVMRDAYGVDRYARLVAVKRRYDPDNVFRGSRNVSPEAS